MIGLGRMGANMAQRLLEAGHEIVGFDPDAGARGRFSDGGARSVDSPGALVRR
jgi:6-phosphogluconate dehydrogenase